MLNLSISLEPDCNKKKLGLEGLDPSATDAVIDPVNILSVNPLPPPVPGNEDVTYKVPFKVSIKTVFRTAPPGGVENGKAGAIIVVEASVILEVPVILGVSESTSKLPVDLKEPDIIWSPLKILEPVVANTEDAVLFNSKEFLEKEALRAYEEDKAYDEDKAYEELKAYDEDTALEAVPNNEPVNPKVEVNDPVRLYEPVKDFPATQTEPDLTSKSPFTELGSETLLSSSIVKVRVGLTRSVRLIPLIDVTTAIVEAMAGAGGLTLVNPPGVSGSAYNTSPSDQLPPEPVGSIVLISMFLTYPNQVANPS